MKKSRRVCRGKRQRSIIIFDRGVYVDENTARPANVRIGRYGRTMSAMRQGADLIVEKPAGFSTVSAAFSGRRFVLTKSVEELTIVMQSDSILVDLEEEAWNSTAR